MELGSPITVGCIADEFPGYGIFKSHDLFWNPLPHDEELLPGKSYYLLPRNRERNRGGEEGEEMGIIRAREGHVRSKSVPEAAAAAAMAPYRVSFDYQGVLRRSQTEVFSRNGGGEKKDGIWKVKLVISPKRLVEILEEEDHTEELIESVRTVAKCGSNNTSSSSFSSSSMAFSDQWSLSTSTANATPSASSKSAGFLEI